MLPWKKALLRRSILLLDLVVYLVLSTLLMDYDYFYDGPKEEYGAWHTMTPFQLGISLSFTIWWWANVMATVV